MEKFKDTQDLLRHICSEHLQLDNQQVGVCIKGNKQQHVNDPQDDEAADDADDAVRSHAALTSDVASSSGTRTARVGVG